MAGDFDDDEKSQTITRIKDMVGQAEQMVQQVHQLYMQYQTGAERLPPNVRRRQLDQLMESLNTMGKPTNAIQFRFRTLFNTYKTYADRWDRIVRKVESGDFKRPIAPKK
ncbi:hypothetical protein K2X30_11715 [bacterium]|nr:hypothetical protein [bacterium]